MARHEEQNASIRDQFGKQAKSYAQLARQLPSERPVSLIEAAKVTGADRVLDVGCGPGRLSLSLARVAEHVTGIDLTPEMLAQAKASQAESGIKNIDWQQGDVLPLPFADGTFSLVVTQAAFHHLIDPAAVLAQMIRVCAPGGRVAVIDLTPDPAKAAAFDAIEKLRDPSHVHALPVEDLRGLGRAAGLQELAVQPYVARLPVEAVLATSFPNPGDMERVRALYREDVASGEDRLGLGLHEKDGEIFSAYPMTMLVWQRR